MLIAGLCDIYKCSSPEPKSQISYCELSTSIVCILFIFTYLSSPPKCQTKFDYICQLSCPVEGLSDLQMKGLCPLGPKEEEIVKFTKEHTSFLYRLTDIN